MLVHVDTNPEMLINDPSNGLFTDPASPTKLSGTAPTGGAAFVTVATPFGATFEQVFTTPLVLAENGSVSLAVVVDAIQTATITVNGSVLTLNDYFPAIIFSSVGSPGIPQFYTSSGTADSYNDDAVLAHIMRIYYQPSGQPAYSLYWQRGQAGNIGACIDGSATIGAYPTDPSLLPPLNDGGRIGGWLGRDPSDNICWTYPKDAAYTAYNSYLTMPRATTIGQSSVISCLKTDTPTPPPSGSTTYAGGCPSIPSTSSATVTLVAQ
jgi:hypothetical protein